MLRREASQIRLSPITLRKTKQIIPIKVQSAEPAVPDKYQQSRLPTPGAFVCPGDFCDFNGENDDPNRNAGPWTTDKAIEKERQALQETISAYRRTMSQTSALGNAIAKTQENNEIDVW